LRHRADGRVLRLDVRLGQAGVDRRRRQGRPPFAAFRATPSRRTESVSPPVRLREADQVSPWPAGSLGPMCL